MEAFITILILIITAYFGLCVILYFMQPSFTYKPIRQVSYSPGDIDLDFEKVQLAAADGVKLSGWYIPARRAKYTVLFCHGNGGNIAHRLDTINILNELGLNCLIFDYRGYGTSEGKPDEQGTYIDAQAAYDWLTDYKQIKPEDIIILGRSLGGAVAAKLAMENQKAGLIIESSFTSFGDIAQKFYPYIAVRHFLKYKYETKQYLQNADCPVLIVHSRNDDIIPFEFGLRLYDSIKGPKEFVEIFGNHNDGFLYSDRLYREGLRNWVDFVKEYQSKAQRKTGS